MFASALFGNRTVSLDKLWSPESGETIGDILIAYTLGATKTLDGKAARLMKLERERRHLIGRLDVRIEAAVNDAGSGEDVHILLQRPFSRKGRHCYLVAFPHQLRERLTFDQELVVLEDGRPLASLGSLHEDIRQHGVGRYSVWNDDI